MISVIVTFIIRIIVLLTISCFYENLVNSSSLQFENASSLKQNVILQKKRLSGKISGIYFHLNLATTFSLQKNSLIVTDTIIHNTD